MVANNFSSDFYLYEILGITSTPREVYNDIRSIVIQLVSGLLQYSNIVLIVTKINEKLRKFIYVRPRGLLKRRKMDKITREFDTVLDIAKINSILSSSPPLQGEVVGYFFQRVVKYSPDTIENNKEKNHQTLLDPNELIIQEFESIIELLDNNTGIAIPVSIKRVSPEKLQLRLGIIALGELKKNKHKYDEILSRLVVMLPSLLDIRDIKAVRKMLEIMHSKKVRILYQSFYKELQKVSKLSNIIITGDIDWIIRRVLVMLYWFLTVGYNIITSQPNLDIKEEKAQGDIKVGFQIKNGHRVLPFFLSGDDLRRHIVILGSSGSGKTRLARIIVEELLRKTKTRIWIFDFHGEYLDLILNYNFKIVAPSSLYAPFALNIFDPNQERPEGYAAFLTNILVESLKSSDKSLTPQMERILSIAIYETVRNVDIRNPLIFIFQLWKWSKRLGDTMPSAINTFHGIINRIRPFFTGTPANVFWVVQSNIEINELIRSNVIFDLSFAVSKGMLKRDLILLHNVLLRYVLTSIVKKGFVYDKFPRLFFVIEEGRYLIPWRKKETALDSSIFEDLAVISRKYGLALCTISQSANLISRDILDNAGTFFIMSGNIDDNLLGNFNNLSQYIQIMPPRHAIVRLTSSPSLIHIEVDRIIPRNIDQEEYYSVMRDKGVRLREKYRPIIIPFETLVSGIIEEKISEDDIYGLTEKMINADTNVQLDILERLIFLKIAEIIEQVRSPSKEFDLHKMINDRLVNVILSELPDDVFSTHDAESLSKLLTDVIIRYLSKENLFKDKIELLDTYYNLSYLFKRSIRKRRESFNN